MRFSASIRTRPLRIGFLVNPRNFASVRRCLRLNTCLWGGIYNPIIPVFDRAPDRWRLLHFRPRGLDIARGYMRFFEPDVIVEAEPGLGSKVGWVPGERFIEAKRSIPLDEFISADSDQRISFASGVDVSAVHSFLYDKEFKYQLKREEKVGIMRAAAKSDAFFEVVVGTFPDDPRLAFIERNYREAFHPIELDRCADTFLSLLKEPAHTPLSFTRHGLEEDYRRASDLRFFVFDPMDAQDVIDFWNLRQFDRDAVPIHLGWFERCVPLMRGYIEQNHRPIPGNPFGTMFHSTVEFARSIPQEHAQSLATTHFRDLPQGSVSFQLWYPQIWHDGDYRLMSRPERVRLTAETGGVNTTISETDLHVTFPTPVPDFLKDGHWYRRATWANVIQPGSTYLADDQLATVYPTNTLDPVFPRLRLGEWSAVSREGWVFPTNRQAGSEYVELQHGREAFIEWFGRHGLKAVPSDAGRVAEQVIRTVGGLHSCAIFADEAVVKLLDDMAATRVLRNKGPEGVEESNYPDRAAPLKRWEDLFRRKAGRMPWVTLDRFTEKPILRAGLEIRCPHCAQRNWFDVKALDYTLTCARCLKEFQFPQDASTLKKLPWLYRVVGPFATPNFARGGYAVALALRALGRGLSTSDHRMTWTTGLELAFDTAKKVEVDFAAWSQRDALFGLSGKPAFVIGEAKSFALDAISNDVVDGLKAVAERFPGAFMAVAVLKSEFSAAERARLIPLAKWGRRRMHEGWPIHPLIVMTGTELFANWQIDHAWKEKGGKTKAFVELGYVDISDLYTFAELTQRIYLDLQPFSADYRKKSKAARPTPLPAEVQPVAPTA